MFFFCSFLALLVPCARSLDPFPSIHPSSQCKATDWAGWLAGWLCGKGRLDEVCELSLAAWIYRDSPSGFLFVSGTATWSHSHGFLVAITKQVGCGRRASGRTHLLFPTGDGALGAHTHTATTSLQD
jgi:hypothetical protein